MAQGHRRCEGPRCPCGFYHLCLPPGSRNSPQCRMSSGAGHTVAHGGGQVAASVQVLDGPTPGLWFVHRALHGAFHAVKVKTETKEKCHERLRESHLHKHMDVHNLFLLYACTLIWVVFANKLTKTKREIQKNVHGLRGSFENTEWQILGQAK